VGAGDSGDPVLDRTGDPVDPAARAARLDEGLEIICALWSGTAVQHVGRHYRLDGLRMTAVPAQRPRIPIWVGGDLRRPGVRRRLTRWDGACVFRDRPLVPDDVHDILDLVRAERGDATGFDVKVSGSPHLIGEFVEAGATWWGQWIAPAGLGATRDVIAAGPPSQPGNTS